MGKKLTLAFGLGAGFLLGSKAGPKYYEAFKASMVKLRHTKLVSGALESAADKAADAVRIQGFTATEKMAEKVHRKIAGPSLVIEAEVVEPQGEVRGG